MKQRLTVPAGWLTESIASVFRAVGFSGPAARTVGEALVEADMRGIPSHGTLLVPLYIERVRKGSVSTREEAEVLVDAGAVAVLDAHHGLGQLTGDQAMALAVGKAHQHGLGAVAVRHAFHFGGAFRYVRAAADAGCIGMAAANTRPLMPAPGGARAAVGNNPLAFGVPMGGGRRIVLDMALSEAAMGKIRLAALQARPIPPTWATDRHGRPTTDPATALAGMLLPAAGPKGYGLALVVDILAGVLSGGAFGAGVQGLYADMSVPYDCAHFFLALDVAAFGDVKGFARRVRQLTGEVLSSTKAPGTDRILLPGELEEERAAAAAREGVPIDESVLREVWETAAGVGVELAEPSGLPEPEDSPTEGRSG
jgi:LDH2 family malate/lactate/ureidoglycolate dehydrogenase